MQVASAEAGQQVSAPKGASGSTEPHLFGWRDAMDIIVKWRQLSEPNDQVSISVDALLHGQRPASGRGLVLPSRQTPRRTKGSVRRRRSRRESCRSVSDSSLLRRLKIWVSCSTL